MFQAGAGESAILMGMFGGKPMVEAHTKDADPEGDLKRALAG